LAGKDLPLKLYFGLCQPATARRKAMVPGSHYVGSNFFYLLQVLEARYGE
jgi:hypothetical protein